MDGWMDVFHKRHRKQLTEQNPAEEHKQALLSPAVMIILHTFTFSGVLCRHVFVSHHRNWTDAQELCRYSYTDLSPDAASLRQVFQDSLSWVGLHKTPPNGSVWWWSGGGAVTVYQNWHYGKPNDWGGNEVAVEIYAMGDGTTSEKTRRSPSTASACWW
ncbi:hypothetical protein N1851_012328 [Merluccius polli]|uniref:C-type lectin domain-containing protein n=1 Tax=Merluccius polli TaxID=89951 RepID=A0AA47MXP3_MERPO|nr:hypothetical protein N1851_012328 [Merluccius polli]